MANRRTPSSGRNRLSDRDMLLDLLATEKYMSHLYDHAIMESSDDQLRDTFIDLQQDEHDTTQMLFEFMQQRGWYNTGANRQKQGRRLASGQSLSGGMIPPADSRYAAAAGARDFGQHLGGNRTQRNRQPAMSGRGRPDRFEPQHDWDF